MKKVIATFAALVIALAALANNWYSNHSPEGLKVGYACAIFGYALRVEEVNHLASLSKEFAAIDAGLPITTVSYNQYDSAQSSRPGERIMGLPRSQALPQ